MTGTATAHDGERVVRRLEAFSDVVIGFGLAQLGLSLVIPQHAIDFVRRPLGIVAFLVTFLVIVRFWWTHARLFRTYFVPNRAMLVLEFVALAGLTVQVFALQLYLHAVPLGEGLQAARIYFALFAFSYGVLGVMFVIGLVARRAVLSQRERDVGVNDVCGILGTVAGCALGNVAAHGHGTTNVIVGVLGNNELVAVVPSTIVLGTFVGWILGMACGRIVTRVRRSRA